MAKTPKKPVLDLALKIALSEEGAAYFIRNKKKLVRFRMVDNSEENGIVLKHFARIGHAGLCV